MDASVRSPRGTGSTTSHEIGFATLSLRPLLSFWTWQAQGRGEISATLSSIPAHGRAFVFRTAIGGGLAVGIYLLRYMSTHNLVFAVFALIFIGTVYNTIWYHRYCSHSAFQFSRPVFNLIFLWTTPLFFRESTYAIPHRVHHQVTEKPGDPYGPHLGWLGTYLAIDSSMKLNVEVTEHHYNLMKRSVAHLGFRMNDCTKYKKTGVN